MSPIGTPGLPGNLLLSTARRGARTVARTQQHEREVATLTAERVGTLEDRIRELENLVKERDLDIDRFKSQMVQVERDFRYNVSLIQERDQEISRLESELAAARRQLGDTKEAARRAEVRASEADAQKDELATQLRSTVTSVQDRARDEVEGARNEAQTEIDRVKADLRSYYDSQLTSASSRENDLLARLEALAKEYSNEQIRRRDVEQQLDRALLEAENEVRAIKALEEENAAQVREADALKSQLLQERSVGESTQRELDSMERRAAQLETEAQRLARQVEESTRTINDLRDGLSAAERECSNLADRAEEAERQVVALRDSADHEGHESLRLVKELKGRLGDADMEVASLRGQLKEAQRDIDDKLREIRSLTSRSISGEERIAALIHQMDDNTARHER